MNLRRVALALLLFVLSLPVTAYGPPTLLEDESGTLPVSSSVLRVMQVDRPPSILAKAVVVMDAASGQVVFEKNAHDRRAPASTTKIMTALVTLGQAQLSDVVKAGPEVVGIEPTIIGLDPGDKLTVEQLLYGMVLPSGNDAAVALAQFVGGSIPKFAALMNAKAAELGLRDTHFANPNGLDDDDHYSSAYDLAQIGRAAMHNPIFERVVSTREYRIQGPPMWLFRNSNRLLSSYPGADGVKTGYTDNAGRCLVFSATRDGRRAIAVVLDSEDQWGDSVALMDYFFADYTWKPIVLPDSPLATFARGEEIRKARGTSPVQLVFPRWEAPYLRWYFSISDGSPSASGNLVGHASYYLFGKKLGQVELFDGS